MGVVDEQEIRAAIQETRRILRRFRAHPLWGEMDAAERYHEVPFSIDAGGQIEHGVIDLLYRVDGAWKIAEFKTDRPRRGVELATHIRNHGYDEQVQRYARAIRLQLAVDADASLVFLNVGNEIAVVPVSI
jgi:ATP-dependent exoDNAse (exonuclease V) beta subunit